MGGAGAVSSRTLAPAPPLPTTHFKDTKGINDMALVTKEAQALESRLEWDLAAKCSNYQQLLIMKKNQGNEQGIQNATSCAGMTPSERLIWYRANQPAVELDAERCAQSSNYRQLLLARGVRAIEENHRVCRVHQVSGASSDEGGRRRSRRLENCSSHCCRCCCLRRQNINIKEKKSRMTSFQIIFLSNSCRCLRKQSINIKNQKSRMTSSQIIFGNFCCCSRRPGINKEMDANNHKWINGPPFH